MSQDRTLDAYSEIAPVYEEYSKNRQAYLDTVDTLVIDTLSGRKRLLDIGAGDGRRLLKIKSETGLSNIIAIEPSEGMAKICREKTGLDVHQTPAQDIANLDIGTFDAITALWNVFGHISPAENRLKSLCAMRGKLEPDGIIILDVNNRHNAPAYGNSEVLKRIIIDSIMFDEKRGDASYEWKIGDKTYQSSGHLFTPKEIEKLFKDSGLKIRNRLAINYETGQISKSRYKGQLFYILESA